MCEIDWRLIAETAKIILPLIGALAIARLAVGWALDRYKAEKTWDRQLTAYAEVIGTMTDMRSVVGRWIDEAEKGYQSTADFTKFQNDRYRAAHRKLDESVVIARLLLPKSTSDLLMRLRKDIEAAFQQDDGSAWLHDEHVALGHALNALVTEGRRSLKVGEDGPDS